MSTAVSGMGSANSGAAIPGMLTIKNTNQPYARMAGVRRNTSKAKKQLNYNHREISGQIVRAKKVQGASNVLVRAKSKLAVLQRCAGTGQYDQREIANAIAHARRMVRCAQLKVRNLKEEEREQKAYQKENSAADRKREGEIKRRVAQKERELKGKIAIEETQEVLKQKRKRNEMLQKRRVHRNQEQGKINEADMKYLRGQTESGRGSYSVAGTGAVLDLSMEAAAFAEMQMIEQEIQQAEAQIEAQVEAEVAMEMGGTADFSGAGVSEVSAGAGDGGAAATEGAASVDVSV